jgi:heavy metal sensor kinase
MNVKSLRFRMTCWYLLALAITFVLAGVLVYRLTSRALRGDLDDLLELRAEGIVTSIDTFWTVESQAALQAGRPLASTSKVDNADFRRLAQSWVEEGIQDPVLVDIVVQLFGPKGELIAASQAIPGATLLPFDALATFLAPDARFLNIVSPSASGERTRFRALTLPVAEEGRLAYVIRVLGPQATVESPLWKLRLILFLVFPIAVVLSGAFGAWLAGRTLRPVDRMVDSARNISAENLHVRLAVPATRDELSRLADTFNGMLERIEQGFSFHRQFWEDVAHELKTPLAIMKGEIEVALKTGSATPEDREVLESNLEEVEHLIRLIEKMLTLARLDRRGAPLEMSEVDVAALAGRASEEFRTLAEDKGIQLVVTGGAAPVPVRGDEARLRAMLYVLLDNAVKFTPPGGTVGVDAGTDGSEVRLAVSDTGPGIAQDELPGIFDRFRRAGRPAEAGGFGLGLSIAKAVAEGHGGRIEVLSRVGAGSTFTVFLPLFQR